MLIARSFIVALVLLSALNTKTALAGPDEYDDSQSHPLRIAAYLMHPVGWLAEWIVFRPFHFLVSATEPQETFFGHRPHPTILADPTATRDYGMARKVPLQQTQVEPKASPPAETVRVVEVPVEKIVEKVVEVEKVIFPAVAFRFDSVELTDLGKGQAYLAAQRLKEKTDLTIVIEGHTDSVGSEEYNRKLGQRRAHVVMNELSSLGIDPGRMSAASVGEDMPLINQNSQWARAANRRVEFQVQGTR